MDLAKLKALVDLVSNSRISELEIVEGEENVRIVKAAAARAGPDVARLSASAGSTAQGIPPPVPMQAVDAGQGQIVKAPTHGIVHLKPAPGEARYVSVGDRVREGQTLCTIEAMKVFAAVTAEAECRIAATLTEDGVEVEAGQPLFRIQ